jgi:hypothetical protein
LHETDRALVVLRFRQGMDYAEIAQAFGLREGTVRMRLSRALARMRATLQTPAALPSTFGAAPAPLRPTAARVPPAAARSRAALPPVAASAPLARGASPATFQGTLHALLPDPAPAFTARLLGLARETFGGG